MKRLENGLIEGINYIYDSNGKIDWLRMIPEEYLYINQDKKSAIEKRLGKKIDQINISEALDTELVITLQGIRYLLDLRGYKQCDIKLDVATQEYAAATCSIVFIPNEESFEQSFTSCASAHPYNTKSFYKNYLVEAASNRALCRAVRFFLKINIVSKDELGTEKETSDETSRSQPLLEPIEILERLMMEKKTSLEDLLAGVQGSENWKELKDIPKQQLFALIGKIKTKN